MKRAAAPGLLVAGLLLAMIVINPFREMLSEDDGWAYARSVQHLLATGKYQLDSWSAANMPVQIYLAAALSKVFGYSLTLLRFTSLALLVVAVFSFYALLREISYTRNEASTLSLGLVASPFVLMLAFTFMSDVQFLGWFLLSLWLYVRGLRRQSAASMLLGSLAAGCAIGTRQFGVAVIGGLLLSWLLSARESRPPIRLMLAGLLIPALAAGTQLHMGFRAPNFTQAYRLAQTRSFLGHPVSVLLAESLWRCSVLLQYLGISVLTVLPIAVARRQGIAEERRGRRLPLVIATLVAAAALIAGLSMSSFLTARPEARHHGLWEPLEMFWLLPNQLGRVPRIMRILDLCGILGAATLVWTGSRSVQRLRANKHFSSEMIFLSGTAASLLLLHLAYVQLNDTYIVPFIPFGLLLIGETVRGRGASKAPLAVCAALSMTLILVIALWMRADYSSQLEAWEAADSLAAAGVQPDHIAAPQHWAEYHGAFDDWIAAGAPGFSRTQLNRPGGYDSESFYSWLAKRDQGAEYRIINSYSMYAPSPRGWQVIASRSYRSVLFAKCSVWTLKRDPAG